MEPSSPSAIAHQLEAWFLQSSRPLPWRSSWQPWQILVAEVMAQQTRLDVVIDYFERFIARFPDAKTLAAAEEREVLSLWSGLGYYSRARNLMRAAARIVQEQDGEVPSDYEQLIRLPGVGPYTAGAVASIAFDRRVSVVDGNVARVASRVRMIDAAWKSRELERQAKIWADQLVETCESPRYLNQGLMELGSTICKPVEPACTLCPIAEECLAYQSGRVGEYPIPRPRRETRRLEIPLLVVLDGGSKVLTLEPEETSLMKGLRHLPHGGPDLIEEVALNDWRRVDTLGSFSHSITNRQIIFTVHVAEVDELALADGTEAEFVELEHLERSAIPSYVRKALDLYDRNRS